jgi:hypothetical protein
MAPQKLLFLPLSPAILTVASEPPHLPRLVAKP